MWFQFPVLRFRFPSKDGSAARPAAGFTIIELLVVISIIAVIATLATGAAMKAVIQARSQRIKATAEMLTLALESYHALHGKWSFTVDPDRAKYDKNDTASGKIFLFWRGPKNTDGDPSNEQVFEKIFEQARLNRSLVDTSVIFTSTPGKGRRTVKEAIEDGMYNLPVGYPDPASQKNFKFFKVTYNFMTDSVTVSEE
jgi:prepilin-type N-terminal cleavage/methylation domain